MSTEKDYTTGDIARLCHVSQTTALKWIDRGLLKGYRVPGSRNRRVPREVLIEFMKQHGLPIESLPRT